MMKIATILHDYLHPTEKEHFVLIDPKEYATRKIKVLALSGSGKTYGVSKICEELMKAGIPVVIVDPPGHYYGLKTKFEVVIFGVNNDKHTCLHADHFFAEDKIEEQAEILAMLVATTTRNVILDMRGWSDTRQQKFGKVFFDTLYNSNKHPRHVVVEEGDVFAPQSVQFPDEIGCRHALDVLVRRGRSEGLGCTIVSQRPAIVYKNILTQAELSIILNLSDPADIAPADKMISNDRDLSKEQKAEILDAITKLPKGEALFYSPRWLKIKAFGKFLPKETPHTGATRGEADYIDEGELSKQFKKVDMDEVVKKLESLSKPKKGSPTIAGTTKVKDAKAPFQILPSEVEELKADLKYKDAKIEELIKLGVAEKQRADSLEKEIHLKSADLQAFEDLKAILATMLPKGTYTGGGQDVTVKGTQVNLKVDFQQETVTLSEKDYLGRVAIMIKRGFFKTARSKKDVAYAMAEMFRLPSLKAGGSNWKPVTAALEEMCNLKYAYLKKDGQVYEEGERKLE